MVQLTSTTRDHMSLYPKSTQEQETWVQSTSISSLLRDVTVAFLCQSSKSKYNPPSPSWSSCTFAFSGSSGPWPRHSFSERGFVNKAGCEIADAAGHTPPFLLLLQDLSHFQFLISWQVFIGFLAEGVSVGTLPKKVHLWWLPLKEAASVVRACTRFYQRLTALRCIVLPLYSSLWSHCCCCIVALLWEILKTH